MKPHQPWIGTVGIAALALATLGCENTAKGVKQDAKENAEAAKPYVAAAAEKAGEKTKELGEKAAEGARDLGAKVVEGAKDLGEKAAEGARKAGEKIEEGAEKAGDKSAEAAKNAGDKAAEGAKDAGSVVDAAKQTAVVKAALIADKGVDALHIDVDTEAATKTVMLKGTVPTAAQKTTAERIAKAKVSEGYSVRNMLAVAKP